MESPGVYMYMNEYHSAIFDWFLCFSIPLSLDLVAYHLERSGMPLHDAVVVNCKNGCVTTEIKAQVPGIWAKGCKLRNCA